MFMTFRSIAFALTAPALVAACVQSGGSSSQSTPATMVATQSTGTGIGGASLFPETITGGDGFQAIPRRDASFATLINAVRSEAGTTPLSYNGQLNSAAQKHARDMFENDYFSHTGRDGSTVKTRVEAEGYSVLHVGENIAQGQKNENAAINSWIKSAPHQANNINPDFEEFGLGRAGSGSETRWVLVFATPR